MGYFAHGNAESNDGDGNSMTGGIRFSGGGGGGVTDHGALTGLGDDDHTQYGLIGSAEEVTGDWEHSGGLTISANATLTALLNASSGDLVLPVNASTPGSPVEGQIYLDTTSGDDIVYYYDGSRSKWLSLSSIGVDGSVPSSLAASYIRYRNTAGFTSALGFMAPRDGTVVAVWRNWTGNPTVQVHDDGTSIASVSGMANMYTTTANGDFAAGSVISLYITTGSSGNANKFCGCILRWRHA